MKKNICLLFCFLSITVCFGLTPRSLHISEIFEYLKGKPEQIQVFKSGSFSIFFYFCTIRSIYDCVGFEVFPIENSMF